MAYIIPDEGLLTKAEAKSLTYPELAALAQRAKSGDASAAIAFDYLPVQEKRLAAQLLEIYGKGKVNKSRKSKPVVPRVPKSVIKAMNRRLSEDEMLNARLSEWLSSDNPQERETARQILSSRGVLR